jgi:hypothetical protein
LIEFSEEEMLEKIFLKNNHHKICFSEKNLLYLMIYYYDKKINSFYLNNFSKNLNLSYNLIVIDINLLIYLKSNETLKISTLNEFTFSFYSRLYNKLRKNNFIIPIIKHLEYCQEVKNILLDHTNNDFTSSDFKFYNNLVIPSLQQIESSGLYYDKELFKSFYPSKSIVDDYLYTEYNIFTSTGRPSNKFGGINFAALNKETGIRKVFTSRFKEDGQLVEFDFDAYHLQLIANEIDYKFPTDINIHDYLGQQYFGKENLSEDEHEQSKQISFRLLYGGIDEDFKKIEFFNLVSKYISKFWNEMNNTGFYSSPISSRKIFKDQIEKVNKFKAWNYFIQLLETENSVLVIQQVLELLQDKQSKLVLYTYDGFLFDVLNDEWDQLKVELQNIFNSKGFHAKIKSGVNYGELKLV